MRPIPQSAVTFVAQAEGLRLTAYRDAGGVWTIGYGHTGPHVREGLRIGRAQAAAWLEDDLQIAARRLALRVKPAVLNALNEAQYAALLSFVFNLGADAKWTIWTVLNARAFDQVPLQMARFNKVRSGGKLITLPGLVRRRAAEIVLWNTAQDGQAPPSSQLRRMETPPIPTGKPLARSKSFAATAATGVAAATLAVGEVSRAVSPFAAQSELVGRLVAVLATLAAGLATAALVLQWLKHRRGAR